MHPLEREFLPEGLSNVQTATQMDELYEKELLKCGRSVWVDATIQLRNKLNYLARSVFKLIMCIRSYSKNKTNII